MVCAITESTPEALLHAHRPGTQRAVPRVLVSGLGLAAVLGCGGAFDAPPATNWKAYAETCDDPGCDVEQELTNEVRMGMIFASPRVSDALRAESEMHETAHIRLNQRLKAADDIRWALEPDAGPAKLHAALMALDPVLAGIIAGSAVRSAPVGDGEWAYVVDSDGEDACGRGPLKLTYRQAHNLGMANVQPSAVVRADVAESEDVGAKREALEKASTVDGSTPDLEGAVVAVSADEVRSGRRCLYVEGEDDRNDVDRIADRLEIVLGPDAPGLPPTSDFRSIPARLSKLYASDFATGFSELVFDGNQSVWDNLANQKVSTSGREFVRANTAHAFGSSAALRCLQVAADPSAADPEATGCEQALANTP